MARFDDNDDAIVRDIRSCFRALGLAWSFGFDCYEDLRLTRATQSQ